MFNDPVCGMDVNPKEAAGKSEYKGATYYFCGPGMYNFHCDYHPEETGTITVE